MRFTFFLGTFIVGYIMHWERAILEKLGLTSKGHNFGPVRYGVLLFFFNLQGMGSSIIL